MILLGEGLEGPPPPPPYFSTKMTSEAPKKRFLETGPPLSQGLGDRQPPLPPCLKVWIRHCNPLLTASRYLSAKHCKQNHQ